MKRKSTLFLLLTSLMLIALVVPACQKKYELDEQALLQLQCNVSDAESIIDEIGETSETTAKPTETEPTASAAPTETEATEPTETQAATEPAATETTKETAKETTKATTKKPTATTVDPSTRVAPVVNAVAGANSVTVSWNKITNPDLVGYKVVASIGDSTPKYSENGYYSWITDANVTSCTIDNGDGYNGGDICNFSGGTQYYFSVTAVYGDEWQKIAGNAKRVTMPGEPVSTEPEGTHPESTLAAPVVGVDNVSFNWSKSSDTTGFSYYKIVASKTDSTPTYPENGHLQAISDPNVTGVTKNFGLEPGTWYIVITTVYSECDITYYAHSNVQTIVIPDAVEP